jgi:CubicO group peptidase (beta-lactamase class C family)
MLSLFAPGDDQDKAKLITAKMCLQHTTGMPNGKKDFYEFLNVSDKKKKISPGDKFQYSSMGFELL